ncbi:MAG: Fic family protein [Patescibacteria group bacterium]
MVSSDFRRPLDEEELQKRSALGVIRASRFIRKFAHQHQPINVDVFCEIHKKIFFDVWPEIAGTYRRENLEITDSKLVLPHYSEVPQLMHKMNEDLKDKLSSLGQVEGIINTSKTHTEDEEKIIEATEHVIGVAAWAHHRITYIHPFREGNGRTGRLAANLILERYGLVGISVKVEKENKNRYRKALAQIDAESDYEPLISIIYEGLIDRYQGVSIKYYEYKGKTR